jgi:ABC-type transport system involved in cytochrome bd biosynthesis fused ATPase/permease subunit
MDEQNRILKTNVEFTLTPDQISVHMAVLGGSGTGKSKFIELLLRQYMM